jgi:mono/diheme cytochrome c family protein
VTSPTRLSMCRLRSLFLVAALLVSAAGLAEAQKFTPRDESPEEFPAGPGREETFYACTACHGFKLIAAQGMNRRQWDETLTFMTSRHGMPNLEGKDRELVLNYLETTYPPRAPTGGWQNPFLKR